MCLFCNKVKVFLDYYGTSYDVVEVNSMTKGELGWVEDGWKKVLIVIVGDEKLNDLSVIIVEFMKWFDVSGLSVNVGVWFGAKKTKAYFEREATWTKWVDECFVYVLMLNIYCMWVEVVKFFDYIIKRGNFGYFECESVRWVGAAFMYVIVYRVLKKRYGIEDECVDLYVECDKFVDEVVGFCKFCGGDVLNNVDLCVFGVLRVVKTFETFADVMANISIRFWYECMEKVVGLVICMDGLEN